MLFSFFVRFKLLSCGRNYTIFMNRATPEQKEGKEKEREKAALSMAGFPDAIAEPVYLIADLAV